ncbi:MAG: hypothetical protein AAGB12_15270 [Pseudomonadota bacterium]
MDFLCFLIPVFCANEEPRPVEMVFDTSVDAGFYDAGFPTSLKQLPDGTINFDNFPYPKHPFTKDYTYAVNQVKAGYSPLMSIYLRFDGEGVDNETFDVNKDPLDFTAADSHIQLIDIDPNSPLKGKRYPLRVAVNENENFYRPEGLLQVIPEGPLLRENTQYALVVMVPDALSQQEDSWVQNETLAQLLHSPSAGGNLTTEADQAAYSQFAALRSQLHTDGINPEQVLGATTWTTGEPTKYFRDLTDSLDSIEPPALEQTWQLASETEDYCILEATWSVPLFQEGDFPYALPLNGGNIRVDAQGEIQVTGYRSTPVHVTIPKTAMEAEGFPLFIYNHGTAGDSAQVFTRGYTNADGIQTGEGNPAEIAAVRQWAASGMGGHLSEDHQVSFPLDLIFGALGDNFPLNFSLYNIFNPFAMRDNMYQSIAERILYRRLLNDLEIDAALCPGAEGQIGEDGKVVFYFNPQQQVVTGQSLGSFTAVGQAALDKDGYQGLVPTGAGSYDYYVPLLNGTEDAPLGNILIPLYFQMDASILLDDPFHPVWAIAEMALAPSNTTLHVNRLLEETPGGALPDVLVVEGYKDTFVNLESQRPLLRALRTDFVGEELDVAPADQLLPSLIWAELEQLDAPVVANADDGRTTGIVRYIEDGILSGHDAFFQNDEAKHQVGCFLETIRDDAPLIIEGSEIHGRCF